MQIPSPNTRTIFTIPQNLHKQAKQVAKKHRVPLSTVYRLAVENYLRDLELDTQQKQLTLKGLYPYSGVPNE